MGAVQQRRSVQLPDGAIANSWAAISIRARAHSVAFACSCSLRQMQVT